MEWCVLRGLGEGNRQGESVEEGIRKKDDLHEAFSEIL